MVMIHIVRVSMDSDKQSLRDCRARFSRCYCSIPRRVRSSPSVFMVPMYVLVIRSMGFSYSYKTPRLCFDNSLFATALSAVADLKTLLTAGIYNVLFCRTCTSSEAKGLDTTCADLAGPSSRGHSSMRWSIPSTQSTTCQQPHELRQ